MAPSKTSTALATSVYTLDMVRDEVQELIYKGIVDPQQPIAAILQYTPQREWLQIEQAVEAGEFLLRDRMSSLFSQADWRED